MSGWKNKKPLLKGEYVDEEYLSHYPEWEKKRIEYATYMVERNKQLREYYDKLSPKEKRMFEPENLDGWFLLRRFAEEFVRENDLSRESVQMLVKLLVKEIPKEDIEIKPVFTLIGDNVDKIYTSYWIKESSIEKVESVLMTSGEEFIKLAKRLKENKNKSKKK